MRPSLRLLRAWLSQPSCKLPRRWHQLFRQHHGRISWPSQSFSSLHPLPAPQSSPPPTPPPPPPATVVQYDVPASQFPPARFLRTLDALPELPAAPSPCAYLYQTLPPLPVCPPLHPAALHKPAIAVAVSGGVDSSVALFLLREAGYAVTGVYITSWDERDEHGVCTSSEDRQDAQATCDMLGVTLHEVDMVRDYWHDVFVRMIDGYRAGLTPNPDALCNREIKFGKLLRWINDTLGIDMLATGHYARTQRVYGQHQDDRRRGDGGTGRTGAEVPYFATGMKQTLNATLAYLDAMKPTSSLRPISSIFSSPPPLSSPVPNPAAPASPLAPLPSQPSQPLLTTRLLTSLDARKDQTYFLSLIAPSSLPHLLFPLGCLTKTITRRIAAHAALPTRNKRDSMGICMIGRRSFPSFLEQYLQLTPGSFLSPPPSSVRIAPHRGSEYYTIGQNAAIGGQRGRWYVARKARDSSGDVIVVNDRLHPLLLHDDLVVADVNWIAGHEPTAMRDVEADGESDDTSHLQLWCRLRNTELLRRCTVARLGPTEYRVRFVDMPHHLVSPGQIVAFYHGEYCLGGGPIARAGPSYHDLNKHLRLAPPV